jgi:hypothetical protein
MHTLASAPIESVIVDMSAYRPSFLPASLMIRVTLRTLIILEIWGIIDMAPELFDGKKLKRISTKLAETIKKSNLCHAV